MKYSVFIIIINFRKNRFFTFVIYFVLLLMLVVGLKI